ncbi:6-bladed beta-propeller [candidate division KSB1 bacterium]|nr:6-bladed beta-propeller [candidate division KSB1 bacterium]
MGKPGFLGKLFNLVTGKQDGLLVKPMAIMSDNSNTLAVLDQGNQSVVEMNLSTHEYHSYRHPECQSLISLAALPDGRTLFTDSQLNTILVRKPSMKKSTIFNKQQPLMRPTGIIFSEVNQLVYVAETAAHRLSVFDTAGHFIKTIGQHGTKPGEFNFPTFLTTDDSGNLYIVDSMNFRVQKMNLQNENFSCFGKNGDGSGDFARPKGIACDSFGHIYVVDALFHNVQIFDNAGNFLERFGQQGTQDGEFWLPTGIFINSDNQIYIADSYNARFQIFQLERNN